MNTRTRRSPDSRRSAIQTIAAGALIVVLAGLVADVVLWPRDQLPPIADADQHRYFTQAFIDRAAAFRGLQSWLAIASALALVVVPVTVALLWPAEGRTDGKLSRWRDRRTGAPLTRGGPAADALVVAGVVFAALLAALPFDLAMLLRARSAGLVVQSLPSWFWHWVLSVVIVLIGAALLAVLCGWLIRRFGRGWWAIFGVCLVLVAAAFQMLSPVVIEPLFADFTRAPAGEVRSDVERIARQSGVDAGEVYIVDAARRTTGANAYVSGLGGTKRVVIYDTLIRDFTPGERRATIAHEFGHARHHDLIAGLVWFAFVALVSFFAIDLVARALAARRGLEFASPAGLAMVIAGAVCAIALSQPAANAWSRAIEARADAFALRVTQQPDQAIALERRLTTQNLSRPEPPAALQAVFGTHPTPMQRIGMAVTVKREHAAGRREPAP